MEFQILSHLMYLSLPLVCITAFILVVSFMAMYFRNRAQRENSEGSPTIPDEITKVQNPEPTVEKVLIRSKRLKKSNISSAVDSQ